MELALHARQARNAGFAMVVVVLGMAAYAAAPASAAPIVAEPAPQYAGHIYVDLATGTTKFEKNETTVLTNVYDNTLSPANTAFSSTDLAAVWGDRVTTLGPGILDSHDFTIFNSGSSAGPLLTVSFTLRFYDGSLALLPPPLGSYSTAAIPLGAGLNPGFYTIITVSGLSGAGINLTTSDILATQTVLAKTGAANRLGFASLNPPTVGTSGVDFYANASTVGPAGYYVLSGGSVPANPGNRINVDLVPVELSEFSID